jgi:hypothetical protein
VRKRLGRSPDRPDAVCTSGRAGAETARNFRAAEGRSRSVQGAGPTIGLLVCKWVGPIGDIGRSFWDIRSERLGEKSWGPPRKKWQIGTCEVEAGKVSTC